MTARTPRHVAGGLLVLGAALQVVAAQPLCRADEVKRVSTALTIDGKLDEAGWAAAPVAALQFLWVARLPDDFQLPQGGVLAHAVGDERVVVGAAIRLDVVEGVSNVLKGKPGQARHR